MKHDHPRGAPGSKEQRLGSLELSHRNRDPVKDLGSAASLASKNHTLCQALSDTASAERTRRSCAITLRAWAAMARATFSL
jgi:hypothetical protein